jgi:hypothetical protein
MKQCIVIATVSEKGNFNYNFSNSTIYDLALINPYPRKIDFDNSCHFFHEEVGFKLPIYKNFIEKNNILEKYNWIWMPDYDIEISKEDIEKLFKLSIEYNLNLSQPSLSHDSYYSFDLLLHQANTKIRYTNFVEIMCPLFKSNALEKVLPSLITSYSGWGQDYLWAYLLEYKNIAIIDDIIIKHKKEIESHLWNLPNGKTSDEEMNDIFKMINLPMDIIKPKCTTFFEIKKEITKYQKTKINLKEKSKNKLKEFKTSKLMITK